MSTTRDYLLLLLLATLAVGCGHDEFASIQASKIALLGKTTFSCAPGHNCPKNAVSITAWGGYAKDKGASGFFHNDTDYEIESCSGFLVSENKVATNFHCIANFLKENCSDKMTFDFLDGSRRLCKAIYTNNPAPPKNTHFDYAQDFAIIELDKPVDKKLVQLKTDHAGFEDLSEVKIVKVDFSRNTSGSTGTAIASVTKCKVIENTVMNPLYSDFAHMFPTLTSCSSVIKSGNSGSMIVNKSGHIGGIVYAGSVALTQEAFDATLKAFGTRTRTAKAPYFGLGLNFKCLKFDEKFNYEWIVSDECEPDIEKISNRYQEVRQTKLEATLTSKIGSLLSDELDEKFSFLEFDARPGSKDEGAIYLHASCLDFKEYEKLQLSISSLTAPVLKFQPFADIDELYRLVLKIDMQRLNAKVTLVSDSLKINNNVASTQAHDFSSFPSHYKIHDCDSETMTRRELAKDDLNKTEISDNTTP